jgi:hypothetical protein
MPLCLRGNDLHNNGIDNSMDPKTDIHTRGRRKGRAYDCCFLQTAFPISDILLWECYIMNFPRVVNWVQSPPAV